MTSNQHLSNEKVLVAGEFNVSSTSDALFTGNQIGVVMDDTLLIKDASLVFQRGHCYGFIGENGSGKSTLLRAVHDIIIDEDESNLAVAYVGQSDAENLVNSTATVLEHCMTGDKKVAALQAELDLLEGPDCPIPDDEAAVRMGEVMDELEALDIDSAPERAGLVLKQLGFRKSQINLPVSELSGGWKNRLEIARALAGRPDLLMLDEPTNHLDLHAVLLLSSLLRELVGGQTTLVVVSHDAAFLDLICTDMVSLHRQTIQTIPGNYSNFEEKADQYRVYHERLYERRAREETRQKASVAAARSSAKKKGNDKAMKQAASRERKAAERVGTYREDGKRFKTNSLKKLDAAYVRLPARAQPVMVNKELSLQLPQAPPSKYSNGLPLLTVDEGRIGYEGAPDILTDVTLNVSPGDRIALVGRNGCGKSTLMKFLTGDTSIKVSRGTVQRRGTVGLVDQNQLALLEEFEDVSSVEFIQRRHAESLPNVQKIREHLGRFGLGGSELPLLPIGALSGGLRVRLILADVFAGVPPDVLLLDEPTNHLDAETIMALGNSLKDYGGAVLTVSHNCAFLLAVCKDLWICRPKDRTKLHTPPCDITVHRHAQDGDFLGFFRDFAEGIVAKKDHEALDLMLKTRVMRQTVVVQQAGASTSLLV